ncbi:MAG TPA: hypothetical protein P5555_12960 [Candidatus Paceibacterota bacterium]|nr:hypothetical protein [Verrucomicrobiota bacterium]HRZ46093.1 hypothetical protein [Candidatus Paceibacterota bacterium]HRZ56713.1 hypothetical protein [Candidatus Paceibacterota bacterium]
MNHQTEPGMRPGFVLAVAGTLVLFLAVIVFFRSRPGAPAPATPSPQTAAARTPVAAAAPAGQTLPAVPPPSPKPKAAIPAASLVDRLGIEVVSVRLTAADRALDVRYRVVDAAKAAALDTSENMAYLVDEANGLKIGTAQPPPPLEVHQPAKGRVYGVMFANAGGALQAGSKVTLVVGQARANNLTVE